MFALRRSEALCVKEKEAEEEEEESIKHAGSSIRSLRRGFSRKLKLKPHNILIFLHSPDSSDSYISSPRYSTEPQSSPDSESERGSRHFSIFKMPIATNSPTMQAVQEPPKTPPKSPYRNTGFHEPFSTERNTTLTHPDADTSENASIEGPEIAVSRTHSRKISFFSHRSKGSYTSGKIDPSVFEKLDSSVENGGAGLYDDIQYVDGSKKNGLLGVELVRNGDEHTNGEVRLEGNNND